MFGKPLPLIGWLQFILLAGTAHGQDAITLVETPAPEWQRQTLEVRCGGNVLAVTLETSGLGPAKLVETAVNGNASPVSERVAIERYLAKIGGATLQGATCQSPYSLNIGILGSRFETSLGEEDDAVELFLLTFRRP